ncbi:MAG: hypothetical protein Q4Q58_05040, partial [Thermoplasmata archaeon]|nr:hypothetical protein [Thermoplasmata archaeon]
GRILKKDPSRVSAVMMKADVCASMGDDKGLLDAYDRLTGCRNVPDEDKVRMVRLLEERGHRDEARALMGGGQKARGFDASVKRYAEKALRRAYTTRTPASDPDILDALGLDPDVAADVSRYLSEMPEAGQIVPGQGDFDYMERLSHDVIVKMKWDSLEDEPLLPLEKAFVAGGFRDADSAKALVAYVHKAMFAPIQQTSDKRLTDVSMALPKGMSVYEIMRQCDLGVYEARVVQSMIV